MEDSAPETRPALEVRNVGRLFGRTVALGGVHLTVPVDSALALLGHNGAGKSTLMRVCATLLRPSRGSVRVFGKDTAQEGAAVRRHLGLLSHESFLYPDLTPTENLSFYARLFGLPDPRGRARELVEQLELAGWAHRPLRTLSRGALQRCALARVLLHRPDLLFLDEPFTGLDIAAASHLEELLQQLHRDGTTLVMSTHNLDHAFAVCTSAAVLARGRVAWEGLLNAGDRTEFEATYRSLTRTRDGGCN